MIEPMHGCTELIHICYTYAHAGLSTWAVVLPSACSKLHESSLRAMVRSQLDIARLPMASFSLPIDTMLEAPSGTHLASMFAGLGPEQSDRARGYSGIIGTPSWVR